MINIESYSNSLILNIAALYPSTTCLGPGERAVLWLQGCLKRCSHCITPEMQPIIDREWVEVDELADVIKSIDNIEGTTLVGGEPLLQYRALMRLLKLLKEVDMTVMLYTGYLYEELLQCSIPEISEVISCTDILIDGTYKIEEDHNEMWRGSANQRIFFLTERYKNWEWVKDSKKRTLSLHYGKDGKYLLIGIPPRNT